MSVNASMGHPFLPFMGNLHYSTYFKALLHELCLDYNDHKDLGTSATTFNFRDFPNLGRLRLHVEYLMLSKPDEEVAKVRGYAISPLQIYEVLPPSLKELQLEMGTYVSTYLLDGQVWYEIEEFATRLGEIVENKEWLPLLKKVAFGNPAKYALYPARVSFDNFNKCSRGLTIKEAYRKAGIELYCWPERKESPAYGFWERRLAWAET